MRNGWIVFQDLHFLLLNYANWDREGTGKIGYFSPFFWYPHAWSWTKMCSSSCTGMPLMCLSWFWQSKSNCGTVIMAGIWKIVFFANDTRCVNLTFLQMGCRAKMTLWLYMKSRWLHANSLYTVQWFARSKLLDPIRLFWTVVSLEWGAIEAFAVRCSLLYNKLYAFLGLLFAIRHSLFAIRFSQFAFFLFLLNFRDSLFAFRPYLNFCSWNESY